MANTLILIPLFQLWLYISEYSEIELENYTYTTNNYKKLEKSLNISYENIDMSEVKNITLLSSDDYKNFGIDPIQYPDLTFDGYKEMTKTQIISEEVVATILDVYSELKGDIIRKWTNEELDEFI